MGGGQVAVSYPLAIAHTGSRMMQPPECPVYMLLTAGAPPGRQQDYSQWVFPSAHTYTNTGTLCLSAAICILHEQFNMIHTWIHTLSAERPQRTKCLHSYFRDTPIAFQQNRVWYSCMVHLHILQCLAQLYMEPGKKKRLSKLCARVVCTTY